MAIFLIAGAFMTLFRDAATLNKHVFEPNFHWRTRRIRADLEKHRNAPGEIGEKVREAIRRLDLAIGVWDVMNTFAYDDPIDAIADHAALGVKAGGVKVGTPLLTRLLGAAGTAIGIRGIPDTLQLIADLFGSDPQSSLSRLNRRFDQALGYYEEGKGLEDALAETVSEVTGVVLQGIDFSQSLANFAGSPNLFTAFRLVPQAVDLAASIVGAFGSVLDFVKEVEDKIPEARRRRERLPDRERRELRFLEERVDHVKAQRWMREELPLGAVEPPSAPGELPMVTTPRTTPLPLGRWAVGRLLGRGPEQFPMADWPPGVLEAGVQRGARLYDSGLQSLLVELKKKKWDWYGAFFGGGRGARGFAGPGGGAGLPGGMGEGRPV